MCVCMVLHVCAYDYHFYTRFREIVRQLSPSRATKAIQGRPRLKTRRLWTLLTLRGVVLPSSVKWRKGKRVPGVQSLCPRPSLQILLTLIPLFQPLLLSQVHNNIFTLLLGFMALIGAESFSTPLAVCSMLVMTFNFGVTCNY